MPDQDWTNDLAKEWNATWQLPHMRAGFEELKRRCKVSLIGLPSGHDALVMAAAEHHRKVGQQEIVDGIEDMGKEKSKHKTLPAPWTPESRGEKPPTEQ